MGLKLSGVIGGFSRALLGAVLGLLIVALCAAQSFASDASAAPVDSLNVVGSAANVLAQASAGAPATGAAAGPTSSLPESTGNAAESWTRRLHISGYLSQNFGMWQNPSTLRSFTPARNNLAVARTTLQIDENFQLNEANSFFMREWFTYDPPYSWNSANNRLYSRPGGGFSVGPHSYGHFTNDALNQYDVRDAWWQSKWGPLTLFVGNQIVIWGQSLSFRVGDVINPNDTAWAFGFANLEQSRKPQPMVHPILYLPDYGPFGSNFLEGVWLPGWSPQWWECDYADQRYEGYITKCGRQLTGQPSLSSAPLMRFEALTPQKNYDYGVFGDALVRNNINGPFDRGALNTGVGNNGLLSGAGFFMASHCAPGPNDVGRNETILLGNNPGKINFANHVPLFLRKPCNAHLSKHQGITAGALGDGAFTDIGRFRIRGYSPQFWNEGLRFHTLFGPAELTSFVYYDNTNQGAQANIKWVPYTNLFEYDEPAEVLTGVTGDMPLPLPETMAEHFPAVGRAEMVYINHKMFDDRRPYVLTTRRFSDVVNWMVALDLTNAYAPWLTSTGDLSANLEVFDSIAMDTAKAMDANDRNPVHILKNPVQVLFNVGTSFYYADFAPTWTMIYGSKGNTFLLFPSITLNPPWTKKYFLKLQAIEVLGGDRQAAQVGGTFKGESFLSALLQYNFDIM